MKRRDCNKCIAYINIRPGSGCVEKCGLGFEYAEELEETKRGCRIVVRPYEDSCSAIELPATKEDFVKTAAELGIEWDINDVADYDDMKYI